MSERRTTVITALIGAVATITVSFITAWTTITTSGNEIKRKAKSIEEEISAIEKRAELINGKISAIEKRAELINGKISAMQVPVGTIFAYGGPINQNALEKEGWMLCDGRELNREKYNQLFKRIGELWGKGDSVVTFNIPDLRGYFLRGVDSGTGVDPDAANRTNKDKNDAGDQVGTLQGMATAAPRKKPFTANASGIHAHGDPTWNGKPGPYELATEYRGPGGADYGKESAPTTNANAHTHLIIGGDKETRPVNAYVHWIIRVQ